MSRTPAAPPAQAATPSASLDVIEALRDFPDRLSPIVVKELRQGLRQPSFVIMFFFLQSVLAMAVVGALVSVSHASLATRVNMGTTVSGLIFGLFGFAVLVIQPIRALGALASETKTGTIDLLLLTRLNSWGIVSGKWLSLLTQSALMLVAMLPYLIMRYFLGGMNLAGELAGLLGMFLLGGMMCAAGTGLSAVRPIILRGVFGVLGGVGLLMGIQMIAVMLTFGGGKFWGGSTLYSSTTGFEWFRIGAGILLLVVFLTYSFLEFGATRIAPPAENRSARKRVIGLAAMLVIPALFLFVSGDEFAAIGFVAVVLIGMLSMADALSENPAFLQNPAHRKFRVLQPGWPAGAVYSVFLSILGLVGMGVLATVILDDSDDVYSAMQLASTCFLMVSMPAMGVALFRPQDRDPTPVYMIAGFGSILLGLVLLMVASVVDQEDLVGFILSPVFPVLGFVNVEDGYVPGVMLTILVHFIYLAVVAVLGRRRWPSARTMIEPPPQAVS